MTRTDAEERRTNAPEACSTPATAPEVENVFSSDRTPTNGTRNADGPPSAPTVRVVTTTAPRPRAGGPRAPRTSPSRAPAGGSAWPAVSVFATVRNEEQHLRRALTSVLTQDYPGDLEVVVAVGPSRDDTYGITAETARADGRVRVVENRTGLIPDGLNVAMRACDPRSEILVRFDGHTALPAGYVRDAVRILLDTHADNVGGLMVPRGDGATQRAVAIGMSHPVGIGPAPFHVGGVAGPSETAYLGAFRREAVERAGGYDELFERAEDWELNLRIRRGGGLVWFDPALVVEYRPRASYRALARQFWSTGRWRREVVRRHRGTASMRYLAPPLTVLALLVGLVVAAAGVYAAAVGAAWAPWLLTLGALPWLGYGLVVVGGALVAGRGHPWRVVVRLPAVLATMHLTWGAGFLRGIGTPR
ncbi:glycosyltransferase family 2 protein [Sanguibacter massiliensis]|uniref:glycosyltransferase family 2 protein n=1 Tax=Sanguibacter massiliensis TaxID=1973217 RepID=UPI001F5DCAAA|nr:glycosyltransferase [Sanguibacter massiliensis]